MNDSNVSRRECDVTPERMTPHVARRLAWRMVFAAAAGFAASVEAWAAPGPTAADARVSSGVEADCLMPLARVWGTIKYFHPALARNSVRWDSVGVAAIQTVQQECSPATLARALRSMVQALHDPLTTVITVASQPSAEAPATLSVRNASTHAIAAPAAVWAPDSVLVLHLGNIVGNDSAMALLGRFRNAAAGARRVVVDVRGSAWSQAPALSRLLSASRLDRALLSRPVCVASARRRSSTGMPGADAEPEFLGWREPEVPCVSAESTGEKATVVFLLDSLSALPSLVPGMQEAGLAAVVGVGPVTDASLTALDTVRVTPGVAVQVRLSSFTGCGLGRDIADTVVVPAASVGDDAALLAARALTGRALPAGASRDRDCPAPAPVIAARYAPRDSLLPSRAWRVMAVFEIYNAVRFFDPHDALIAGGNWDSVATAGLRSVAEANSRSDYVAGISRLSAALNDGHAMFPPNRLLGLFGTAFPPIVVARVEGQLVVVEVIDSVAAGRLRRGDVIRRVDGDDAEARFAAVRALVSGSNDAARDGSAASFVLAGADSSRLTLAVRSAGERWDTVSVMRRQAYLPPTFNPGRGPVMREFAGNIGYVDLRLLPNTLVDSVFARFRSARALILDLRGYPQGTHPRIASRLTRRRTLVSILRKPIVDAPGQRTANVVVPGIEQATAPFLEFTQHVVPDGREPFGGRVYVLIDDRSVSQAEQAAMVYRVVARATLIGTNSAGANGAVTTFTVPGRVGFGFTGTIALTPEGASMQGSGLSPDVRVSPTIQGLRAGRDEVLACALRVASGAARRCGAR